MVIALFIGNIVCIAWNIWALCQPNNQFRLLNALAAGVNVGAAISLFALP